MEGMAAPQLPLWFSSCKLIGHSLKIQNGAEPGWGKVEESARVPWPMWGAHFIPCQLLVLFLSKCVC